MISNSTNKWIYMICHIHWSQFKMDQMVSDQLRMTFYLTMMPKDISVSSSSKLTSTTPQMVLWPRWLILMTFPSANKLISKLTSKKHSGLKMKRQLSIASMMLVFTCKVPNQAQFGIMIILIWSLSCQDVQETTAQVILKLLIGSQAKKCSWDLLTTRSICLLEQLNSDNMRDGYQLLIWPNSLTQVTDTERTSTRLGPITPKCSTTLIFTIMTSSFKKKTKAVWLESSTLDGLMSRSCIKSLCNSQRKFAPLTKLCLKDLELDQTVELWPHTFQCSL